VIKTVGLAKGSPEEKGGGLVKKARTEKKKGQVHREKNIAAIRNSMKRSKKR